MTILATLDPCGSAQRKTRKLKRRIYRSKVIIALLDNLKQ